MKEDEMKIWHQGYLKTQKKVWADQSPYEIYRDACRRMEAATTKYDIALRRRWPMLGEANRAMTVAYAAMSQEARDYEDDVARRDAEMLIL